MPAISKIRLTNLVYDNGLKRYNDELFKFDGLNGAILLENSGGKTVFIQAALQAVMPHSDLAERRIRDTLSLDNEPCHIAVEWIIHDRPRRYVVTAVTLFIHGGTLDSFKYVYEYGENDANNIENMPFVARTESNKPRPASKQEISEYYSRMQSASMNARRFNTIAEYEGYLEQRYFLIHTEWNSIRVINSAEGDVEKFFEECKSTAQLVDKLIIPTVEQSLNSKGEEDFSEIFRKQREHLKKLKKLRVKIDESISVDHEIGDYVKVYEFLHAEETRLQEAKGKMQGIFCCLEEMDAANELQLTQNEQNLEELQQQETELAGRRSSHALAVMSNEINEKALEFSAVEKRYLKLHEDKKLVEDVQTRLMLSKAKNEIEALKLTKEVKQKRLDEIELDTEEVELEDELERNSRLIRGYFVGEEDRIAKETRTVEWKRHQLNGTQAELDGKLKLASDKHHEVEKKVLLNSGRIEDKEKTQATIQREILSNWSKETIEEEEPKWWARSSEVNELSAAVLERKTRGEEQRQQLLEVEEQSQQQLNSLTSEHGKIEERVNNLLHQEELLLMRLKEINGSWKSIKSIYEKKETFQGFLENRIDRLRRAQEELHQKERMELRLIDDYGDSSVFTAEPLLYDVVQRLFEKVSYVETGSNYVRKYANNHGMPVQSVINANPCWAMTVVTLDAEKQKVMEQLRDAAEGFTRPVLVISTEEASAMIKGSLTEQEEAISTVPSLPDMDSMIVPPYWDSNLIDEEFTAWLKQLEEKKEVLQNKRIDTVRELKSCEAISGELGRFLNDYPYEAYHELLSNKEKLREEIIALKRAITDRKATIENLEKENDRYQSKLDECRDEIHGLTNRITRAKEYFELQKLLDNLKQENAVLEDEKRSYEQQIKKIRLDISGNTEQITENDARISELKIELSVMQGKDLYKDTVLFQPEFGNVDVMGLEAHRKELRGILDNKTRDRSALKEDITRLTESIKAKEKGLHHNAGHAGIDVESLLNFPYNGDELLDQYFGQRKDLEKEIERLQPNYERGSRQIDKLKTTYENRLEDHLKLYGSLHEFSSSLKEAELEIDKDTERLLEKRNYLQKRISARKERKAEFGEVLEELKRKNERFDYFSVQQSPLEEGKDIIVDFGIDEELKISLTYSMKEEVDKRLKELQMLQDNTGKRRADVEEARARFVNFCNTRISDVRLKENAVLGIDKRQSYDEVVDWQSNMKRQISMIIKYAEEDIIRNDSERQQFINLLHTYLEQVIAEIALIPKSTRVKVGDEWKEIFTFEVPSWEAAAGKEALSNFIDRLIDRLDRQEFKEESGKENDKAIKQELEKKFKTRELLKIVLQNKEIVVKCRKVANDNSISSKQFSWETSNKWSGGEKWSKNMCLFMGILNYMAEKRGYASKSKRYSRSVILDNPFGKASSDHVLNPVFFIAEKLGFQIIALTAHAEGKFIRDRFPVVYSLVLRPARNGDTSIIDIGEKKINHAYLMDSDPSAVNRLADFEQVSFL